MQPRFSRCSGLSCVAWIVVPLALLLPGLLPAAEKEPNPAPRLAPFEPFLGKTWKALVNAEKQLYDVARWELAIGGQAVRIVHSVADGLYGGETIVMWDRAREELVYFYFTTAGFYTRGTMWFDEQGRLQSRETVEGHEAGVNEVRATQELLPDGRLQVRTRMLRNGSWEERGEVIYSVDANARVVLPD